jgi:hypothetical protein
VPTTHSGTPDNRELKCPRVEGEEEEEEEERCEMEAEAREGDDD